MKYRVQCAEKNGQFQAKVWRNCRVVSICRTRSIPEKHWASHQARHCVSPVRKAVMKLKETFH